MICKTPSDFDRVRAVARMTAEILRQAADAVAPGVTTLEINDLIHGLITARGATPCFLNYRGFPKSACVSINHEVIHGIPAAGRVIQSGDIVSIDVGVHHDHTCGDCATTVAVGGVTPERQRLLDATRRALEAGVAAAVARNRVGDISHAVQTVVESAGCSVVRDFVGHGIGRRLHEDPQVPNFGKPGRGTILRPGHVLCVEPMVNAGACEVRVLDDKWTVVTRDGLPSAHFEHMVLVTEGAPEILTPWRGA
ncbi:MAG: type I methionyl aminopeptidase [Kiritimatiellaeota bacterium]|nr:type I methionyl aminopeptidase [Kiritimatiellota bacterium]